MSQDTAFTDYREHDDDDLSLGLIAEDTLGSPPSLNDTPWSKWTDEQKQTMSEHVQYHTDKIAEIIKCWASGPIPKSQLKQHKTDLSFISAESGTKKTNDAQEFLNYLKSKCHSDGYAAERLGEMPTDSLNNLQQYLRASFDKLNRGENMLLLDHILFGSDLARAKNLFKSLTQRQNKITWQLWISENVKISKSYANKHVAMYRLVSEYPKLKKLAISFKELYTISRRIRTIFSLKMMQKGFSGSKLPV